MQTPRLSLAKAYEALVRAEIAGTNVAEPLRGALELYRSPWWATVPSPCPERGEACCTSSTGIRYTMSGDVLSGEIPWR